MIRTASLAAAAVATAALTALPGAASAQSYYGQPYGYSQSYSGGYYDPCRRDQGDRGATGALIGGAIGAVTGSQLASRGRRTEGSVLGGVLGAVVGSAVGRDSAGCRADNQRTYYGGGGGYSDSRYYGDDRRYDDRYRDDRYYDNRSYDDRAYSYGGYDEYDRYGGGSSYGYQDQGGGCRMSESNIQLPDGRVETRYVRVCPDSSGRYRIVD